MTFQDDSGVRLEEHRGPLWSAFAVFASQLERMITLNLGWSLQLIPAMLAIMFDLPLALRVVLVGYTILAIPPATAVLYGVVARACSEDHVDLGLTREVLAQLAWPGLKTMTPLAGLFGLLLWALQVMPSTGWFVPNVALTMLLLFVLVCANFWGPRFIDHPDQPALTQFIASARLVWRFPAQSVLVSGVVLLSLVIGVISIGGLFLAVPVLIALLQTQMYRAITSENGE